MIGPLFTYEFQHGLGRGRVERLRLIYAAWLVVEFAFFFVPNLLDANGISQFAVARSYVRMFLLQNLILLLAVTPALTAGAISDDKARGTLDCLLTSQLTIWEIVAGKLCSRLLQIATLAMAGLPFFCFMAVYAELTAETILALITVMAAPLFPLAALSVLASVWSRRTRDAVLGVYAWILALGLVFTLRHAWLPGPLAPRLKSVPPAASALAKLDDLLICLDPRSLMELPLEDGLSGELRRRLVIIMLTSASLGAGFFITAVLRLRPVYRRQLEQAGSPVRDRGPKRRVSVGTRPLRWKECQLEGIAVVPWMRCVPRWLGLAVVCVASAAITGVQVGRPNADIGFLACALGAFVVFGLTAGMRASEAVCGERLRQTWDSLLLTPMTMRQIVNDKAQGVRASVQPYLIAYAIPAVLATAGSSLTNMFSHVLLLLAAWLEIEFMSAVGIWWSVRTSSPWRSLLYTLVYGFGCEIGLLLISLLLLTPLLCVSAGPLVLVMSMIGTSGAALTSPMLAVCLVGVSAWWFPKIAEQHLRSAAEWLAEHERSTCKRSPADREGLPKFFRDREQEAVPKPSR